MKLGKITANIAGAEQKLLAAQDEVKRLEALLEELERDKVAAENLEIVKALRGARLRLEELPEALAKIRAGGEIALDKYSGTMEAEHEKSL